MSDARPTPPTASRIAIVEELRGVAALAVAWFHFTNGNPRLLDDGMLKASGANGWVGVHVFFVISGFVIPYAMYRAGYDLRSLPRFLAKRLIRLEPPYLVCVLLTVVLAYVSVVMPGYRGAAPAFEPTRLALHVGYLIGFSSHAWLNPVFWSLAIEFQFYLTVALVFPLIAHERAWVRVSAVWILFALSLVPVPLTLLLPYLGLFALGMLTFHWHAGWLRPHVYGMMMLAFTAGVVAVHSFVVAIPALGAALAIGSFRGSGRRWLVWLGTISYSFYLLHVPIGGRIVNLGERLGVGPVGAVATIVGALTVSLAASALYHRWLERPAQDWSSRIRYGESRATEVAAPALSPSFRT